MTLSWTDIMALDEGALNLAMEELAGRVWTALTDTFWGAGWMYTDPRGRPTYGSIPHLHTTADWTATMALAWRYGISFQPTTPGSRALVWYQEDAEDQRCLIVTSEEDARIALCKLALWRATLHQKEPPHGHEPA